MSCRTLIDVIRYALTPGPEQEPNRDAPPAPKPPRDDRHDVYYGVALWVLVVFFLALLVIEFGQR